MKKGKLYLIPTTLGEGDINYSLPGEVKNIIHSIDEFIVEDERSARRFLKLAGTPFPLQGIKLHTLNEHTIQTGISSYLNSIDTGKDIGLLSEAGCPGVADPGAEVVKIAHEKNIRVVPLVGPSSILLALMASGFNGQNFCFHGYLPKERNERIKKLKTLEHDAFKRNQTQIFIETPYRNHNLLEDIFSNCTHAASLCIACDITLSSEFIQTKTVGEWKKKVPDINKRLAIFLIYK